MTTQWQISRRLFIGILFFGTALLAGCETSPWTTQVKEHWGKERLLICDDVHDCVDAKIIERASSQYTVAIQIRFTNPSYHYDIQRISFDNDIQVLSYMPTQQSMRALSQGQYLSFNQITVPANLMQQLQGQRIAMNIYTDKGLIRRYLWVDGLYTPLYAELEQRRGAQVL